MNQMAKSLSFKPINYNITRNKSIGRQQCKKHPKHRQSPGVCSLCLSEKLSKVSTTTTSRSRAAIIKARARAYYYDNHSSTASSLSSTSYESSYASSNGGSPLRATMHHRRNFSDVYNNNNHAKDDKNNNNGGFLFFSKSKSMAHVEKESNYGVNKLRLLDDKENFKKKEKKNVNGVGRIWSNLLGLRRFNNYQKRSVNVDGSNHLSQCSSTVVLAS